MGNNHFTRKITYQWPCSMATVCWFNQRLLWSNMVQRCGFCCRLGELPGPCYYIISHEDSTTYRPGSTWIYQSTMIIHDLVN